MDMANAEKSVGGVVRTGESVSAKRVYRTNYLSHVIFKVDFPKVLELSEGKTPSKLQEEINEKFPIVKDIKKKLFEYEIKDGVVKSENKDAVSWEFSNKEKTKKVFVDANFVSIEYFKYGGFDELFGDINLIFGMFTKLYPVKIANKIGLRYINEIKLDSGDPMDWSNLIHKSLYCTPKGLDISEGVLLQSMHSLELKEKENRLIFHFGFFNSEYPGPITRKEFVLDYDCIAAEERDISEIYNKSKELNGIISMWFEKSILDGLRDKMDGV